jgi:ubiquitin C-terminal hydrolase
MGLDIDNEGNSEKNFWKKQNENKHRPNKNENASGKEKNATNPTNKNIETPNLINEKIEPRGLNNIGATCYMNSVLQCLYHIFDLSNELLILYKNKKINESLLKKHPMTYAFLDVIYDLSFDKKKSISPYNFKEIIGKNKSFRNFEANDSKNLTLYILDMLNRELNENKIISENELYINKIRNYKEEDAKNIINYFNENQNSLIGDLFIGLKSTNYTCLKCKHCIKNYQIYNIITCNVEKTFMIKYKKSGKRNIETSGANGHSPCTLSGRPQCKAVKRGWS